MQRFSDYHKYDAALLYLTRIEDSKWEKPRLEVPSFLQLSFTRQKLTDYFYHDVDVWPTLSESFDRRAWCVRQICSWRQKADELKAFYTHHLEQYRHALSYRNFHHIPEGEREQYTAACLIDSNYENLSLCFPLSDVVTKTTFVISPERFYRAVMGRVLDSKALQLFAFLPESESECESSGIDDHINRKITDMWSRNSDRTLQESFEILDLFDYTSNFLQYQVFPTPDEHLDWADVSQKNEILGPYDTLVSCWIHCHERLRLFLTPFDILSLFKNGIGKGEIQQQTSMFLLKCLKLNTIDNYDNASGMEMVENDVSYKLRESASEAWKGFRAHYWQATIRGRVFADEFDASKYSIHHDPEAHSWWESLQRTDIRPQASSLSVPMPRYWFVQFDTILQEEGDSCFFSLD